MQWKRVNISGSLTILAGLGSTAFLPIRQELMSDNVPLVDGASLAQRLCVTVPSLVYQLSV